MGGYISLTRGSERKKNRRERDRKEREREAREERRKYAESHERSRSGRKYTYRKPKYFGLASTSTSTTLSSSTSSLSSSEERRRRRTRRDRERGGEGRGEGREQFQKGQPLTGSGIGGQRRREGKQTVGTTNPLLQDSRSLNEWLNEIGIRNDRATGHLLDEGYETVQDLAGSPPSRTELEKLGFNMRERNLLKNRLENPWIKYAGQGGFFPRREAAFFGGSSVGQEGWQGDWKPQRSIPVYPTGGQNWADEGWQGGQGAGGGQD